MYPILLFSILFLGLLIVPASAQSYPNHIVINEVDLNPPGDDSVNVSEWVELYNPTNSKIDLSGWKIASTTVLKKTMTIPTGTFIEPEKFLKYSYQTVWFTDSNDSVELRDASGNVIDKTPLFADIKNDFSSWQRIYDGFDTDSMSDWKFATSNAGSTNGKETVSTTKESVTVTVSTDKFSYLFGQTAIISGQVSEEVVITKPFFQPEKIFLTISGPNYNKTIELFPDRDLKYKTTLNLQKVLGITEGTYNLSVQYAGASSGLSFNVGTETISETINQSETLSISTDKLEYLPGQTLALTGTSSKIVPFEGMKFSIKDPSNNIISNGMLYPTNGKFSTTVFLTTVKPVYGTYEITGEYDGKTVKTMFEVVRDLKEAKPISLWTDKSAYSLGDTVSITGRLNNVWISSLDLEIVQTKNLATSVTGSGSGFKILDVVRIQGDGTFSYSFKIPENGQRLGDYIIKVSKEIGLASVTIHAVEDPNEFIAIQKPLTLSTTKPMYELGDTLVINGFIENPSIRSSYEKDVVKISISDKNGKPLQIVALPDGAKTRLRDGVVVSYEFTAVPTESGSFSIKTSIAKNVFQEGTYLIKAQYLDLSETISVDISDPLKIDGTSSLSLNKEVFGLGETLKLSGTLPPTGDVSVTISITKPDGSTITSGASIDKQKFSWSWQTPITEKPESVKSSDDRSVLKTNYGVYKIRVSTSSFGENLFFKVSQDPTNDSLDKTPLYVTSEKSLYRAGEKLKVVGNVIARTQGNEGLVIPERVTLRVLDGIFPYKLILESQVYPNHGGEFQSLFDLPPTVFAAGEYKINAIYQNKKVESVFSVANDFLINSDEPVSLLLATDQNQYHPGDIVVLTGKPNKLIYLEKFDVSVIQKSGTEITCGSFICGKHLGKITTLRPSPSGSFTYEFSIPDNLSSIGTYEITVDADFETKSIKFDVVERPHIVTPSSTIIEKQNRIPDSHISIIANEKTIEENNIAPRVITGSLLVAKEDQANVALRVTSESGICVIGPELSCLVNESTRKPGQIYDVVNVDGVTLKVRYSGSDARLEKFDILPESDEFLPNSTWNVDVIKEDQASRFYYKINYKTIE